MKNLRKTHLEVLKTELELVVWSSQGKSGKEASIWKSLVERKESRRGLRVKQVVTEKEELVKQIQKAPSYNRHKVRQVTSQKTTR